MNPQEWLENRQLLDERWKFPDRVEKKDFYCCEDVTNFATLLLNSIKRLASEVANCVASKQSVLCSIVAKRILGLEAGALEADADDTAASVTAKNADADGPAASVPLDNEMLAVEGDGDVAEPHADGSQQVVGNQQVQLYILKIINRLHLDYK